MLQCLEVSLDRAIVTDVETAVDIGPWPCSRPDGRAPPQCFRDDVNILQWIPRVF